MMASSSDFVVAPLLVSDFPQIRAIERAGQKYPWSDDALRDELASDHALHFAACPLSGEMLSAFILCRLIIDEVHIHNLCTLPRCRRCGQGRLLLMHALGAARSRSAVKAFLEVASSNLAAVSLYSSAGFRVDFERKNYYASGEDALVMSAALT